MRHGRLATAAIERVNVDDYFTYGVDGAVARSYGHLAAAVVRTGRQPRARAMDLLIAATAHAHGASLMTRNPGDLRGIEHLVDIVTV